MPCARFSAERQGDNPLAFRLAVKRPGGDALTSGHDPVRRSDAKMVSIPRDEPLHPGADVGLWAVTGKGL